MESDLKHARMQKDTKHRFGFLSGRLLTTLAALLIWSTGFGQGFEISFGGPKEDRGVAILETVDDGYIEVGISEGILGDDNDFDIFVVRTDVDGTKLWSRRYDPGFEEFPTEIIATHDGNYLISGFREETPGSPIRPYLLKINDFGQEIWSRTYGSGENNEQANHVLASPDGGYLLTGTTSDEITDRQDILLIKVDEEGNEVWREVIGGARDEEGVAAVPSPNGYVIGAKGRSSALIDNDIHFYGVSDTGNLEWLRVYGEPTIGEQLEDMIPTSDGFFAFVGSVDNFNTALIAKARLNGDTLWYNEVDLTPLEDELFGLIEDGDALVATGTSSPTGIDTDVLMVKVNRDNGQVIYQRRIGDDEVLNNGRDLVPLPKGGYAIAGYNSLVLDFFNDLTLFKTDSAGLHLTNHIRGNVYYSEDGCNPYTPGDLGLEGWLVRAESDEATFFSSTDSMGRYDLQVDLGTYTVSLLQRNDRWEICNPVAFIVDFMETYDSTRNDFPLEPAITCPLLSVELSAGPAFACEIQTITVNYGNEGSVLAEDVRVTIELDELLGYSSSTIPVFDQDGQTLTFELPDLSPGAQGSFEINAAVGCIGVQDQQALATRAVILPEFNCSPLDPEWDLSSIEVTSECDGDSIRFQITNPTNNPMSGPLDYIVIEDQVMIIPPVTFELDAQSSQQVALPAGEGTYRLIAEQSPGHPGNQFPTAVVEGCSLGEEFTTGLVAQFADNDGDLNIDILTQEVFVLNSSVPLALRAYPKGYQDSIITPKTDLEYTFFFTLDSENDTIGRVVIRDTLSTLLDLNSLEMGAASHPYDFTLYQNGVLKITFDSIQLHAGGGTGGADTNPGQQGYVTIRLSQKPNNVLGAVISNRAAVYFDYRTPLISNSVRHVVGCQELFVSNCLLTSSVNYSEIPGVNINVFPNPLDTEATVRVEGWEDIDTAFELKLFDANGREVYKTYFQGDQTQILRHNLPAATYIYELRGDGILFGTGKLFVQ